MTAWTEVELRARSSAMVFPFQDNWKSRCGSEKRQKKKKKKKKSKKGGQAGAGTSFCRSARGDRRPRLF